MNIPADYVDRIQRLGYTKSEALFLYIVALFSGYFTMAQFRAFTGSRCGKRQPVLLKSCLGKGTPVCALSSSYRRRLHSLFQKSLRSDG